MFTGSSAFADDDELIGHYQIPLVWRRSEHPFRRQLGDLAFRHPQELAVDILVVLAVARRAAVDAAAREGGALAEFDRHLGDRPAADLAAGHLGEPREVRELGIVIAAILGRLADPGRHA